MAETNGSDNGNSNGDGAAHGRRLNTTVTLRPSVPGVEARDGRFPGPSLIPALTAIQRDHGWLPRQELLALSREWKRPLYEIEGVMSFYPHFRTSPPKKVDLAVCHDLSCWLNDAEPQIAELRARYGDDVEVNVHEVSCLGRCDIAPAVAVQEQPANIDRVHEMVEAARADKLDVATAKQTGQAYPNDPYGGRNDGRYGVLRRVLAGEVVRGQREQRYVRPSGESVWVLLSVSMVDSMSPYLIAQVQDITELRAAADERERHAFELERSNAELERFASVAAHDLRTPLRTISGFAELLLEGHGGLLPPQGREFVQMIRDSAEGSGRLLDNLLSYARAGGGRFDRELVDAGRTVTSVLTALRSQIEGRDAEVTVGALPTVSANAVQLAQVFQNLIDNAIKYTPAERRPRISITARRDGGMVCFSVSDNGIGVAPEEAAPLFTMFARGMTGPGADGAGIGLAICSRIVAGHDGRLWVDPAPGGGSVFSFTFPAA